RIHEEGALEVIELLLRDARRTRSRQGLELVQERLPIAGAAARILGQELEHERVDVLRDPAAGRNGARRRGLVTQVTEGGLEHVSTEGGPPREQLVEDGAEGVDVAPRIGVGALDLLRGDALRRRTRRAQPHTALLDSEPQAIGARLEQE